MKVKDILRLKGPEVITIGEEKPLSDAVRLLVNNNIGALLVLNAKGRISGIISERDIIRFVDRDPANLKAFQVREFMTRDVIIVEPEDDISYVISVMTENRVRHLPVVSDKILIGLISIGDLVKAQISDKESENKYLRDYISGNVPKM